MIQVIEPATEAVLEELPRAGVEEVDAAVERAREAFAGWRAMARSISSSDSTKRPAWWASTPER